MIKDDNKIIVFNKFSGKLAVDGLRITKRSYNSLNKVLYKIDSNCQIIKHYGSYYLNNKGRFFCLDEKIIVNL